MTQGGHYRQKNNLLKLYILQGLGYLTFPKTPSENPTKKYQPPYSHQGKKKPSFTALYTSDVEQSFQL